MFLRLRRHLFSSPGFYRRAFDIERRAPPVFIEEFDSCGLSGVTTKWVGRSLHENPRVARALLENAEHLGRETESGRTVILHKIRQSDIAAMAGAARENVSRTPTELKRRNLICQSSGYYFINDKQKLLRVTEDIL